MCAGDFNKQMNAAGIPSTRSLLLSMGINNGYDNSPPLAPPTIVYQDSGMSKTLEIIIIVAASCALGAWL